VYAYVTVKLSVPNASHIIWSTNRFALLFPTPIVCRFGHNMVKSGTDENEHELIPIVSKLGSWNWGRAPVNWLAPAWRTVKFGTS
jgi:hypothetical protein